MSKKRGLTPSQEERRIEGLRILARIIARHYLAHPELYPAPTGGGGQDAAGVNAPVRADGNADRKEAAE